MRFPAAYSTHLICTVIASQFLIHQTIYHMAQSAPKNTLPGNWTLLGRTHLGTPTKKRQMGIILKPAILAIERLLIDILYEAPPDKVALPHKPIYEDIDNSIVQSERNQRIRNEQLKNTWLNKWQKPEAEGKLCDKRPWKFRDNKAISLFYLTLRKEGRQVFGSKESTVQRDQITTIDLWETLHNVFTKQRNIVRSLHFSDEN